MSTSSERQLLETFLDLYRDILKRKLTGLSDQQIRQRHVPSATTLGGLAKHLAAVEREWFQVVLARRPAEELDAPLPDNGWTLAGDEARSRSRYVHIATLLPPGLSRARHRRVRAIRPAASLPGTAAVSS